MLNFPKIKKVLTDEHKLWNYLITDDKYPSRNYELDLERRMIRKKGLWWVICWILIEINFSNIVYNPLESDNAPCSQIFEEPVQE